MKAENCNHELVNNDQYAEGTNEYYYKCKKCGFQTSCYAEYVYAYRYSFPKTYPVVYTNNTGGKCV